MILYKVFSAYRCGENSKKLFKTLFLNNNIINTMLIDILINDFYISRVENVIFNTSQRKTVFSNV